MYAETAPPPDRFLRTVLAFDAAFEALCAVVCFLIARGALFLYWSEMAGVFAVLGGIFLLAAVVLAYVAYRPRRRWVWIIIVANALSAVLILLAAALGALQTLNGNPVYIVLFAAILAAFAVLEYVGLRRAS